MKAKINIICDGLCDFTQTLKQTTKQEIKNVLLKINQNPIIETNVRPKAAGQVSNPERPWILAGGAAFVGGVAGAIFSSNTLLYILGAAGLVSVIYGGTKKKQAATNTFSHNETSNLEPKSYEVAEKVIEITKMIEAKWRTKVEECKADVQRAIETSSASVELKDSLMSQTFITERVSIDFDNVINRLSNEPPSSYPTILTEFEKYVNNCIDKAANDQIAIYRKISNNL